MHKRRYSPRRGGRGGWTTLPWLLRRRVMNSGLPPSTSTLGDLHPRRGFRVAPVYLSVAALAAWSRGRRTGMEALLSTLLPERGSPPTLLHIACVQLWVLLFPCQFTFCGIFCGIERQDVKTKLRARKSTARTEALKMAEHDAEEFRLAFEGRPCEGEADRIRTNDPALKFLWLQPELSLTLSDGQSLIDSIGNRIKTLSTVSAIDATILTNAPKLKDLWLNLGSESLRLIVRTLNGSSIEVLALRNSDIGDISAIGCNLPNLKCLRLSTSGITSVPPLHGFPELTSLVLNGNKIDKEGFARLNAHLASDSVDCVF
ncbi:hypothetical protein THAOC_34187 [Thalassiosira oceanica]|uniref:Uncharacterized protein n=1 Tax=Thalassiosira oceanica TaxID=159749 RepID=K0RKA3_THAOC|nr:hypothetical protein THAOC_34187 [Thalassiosira oceanica]|eukprot:EJK47122.1 hypothetical protein THAOC_34187 [Thalassiosira oceanica]